MALGAAGVISVVSNVAPAETQAMAMAAWDGDFDTASALQLQLRPLTELLFCEVNPVSVKAAMKCIGYDCGECRLPLGALSEDNMSKIENFFA
jgi:4-hydroxy-tetrahydrodipicolinate synthase